jgi:hypothetical protein
MVLDGSPRRSHDQMEASLLLPQRQKDLVVNLSTFTPE